MKNYQIPPSIDMNDFLDTMLNETPKESVIFIEKTLAINTLIFNILEEKGLLQKDLASMLGKTEAEISKWLSGNHNMTLRTLAKIEAILGETIVEIAHKEKEDFILEKKNLSRVILFNLNKQQHTRIKSDSFQEVNIIIPDEFEPSFNNVA